jgi:organic hydroperoxide reductase OsmC/OhrA
VSLGIVKGHVHDHIRLPGRHRHGDVDGDQETPETPCGMVIAMSETRTYKVDLRFVRGYEFVATFPEEKGLPPILFDEPPPMGEGTGPNAAAVLAAAVGNCLAASLAFCLRKARVEPVDLTAAVVARVARNEHGRFRISSIDVELTPEIADTDRPRFERCEHLFQDFCIVTESVRRGIDVNVKVVQPAAHGKDQS